MVSPVRFSDALKAMITQGDSQAPDEIGPSGALDGPVSQVLKGISGGSDIKYCAAWARGAGATKTLFDVAGHLFLRGVNIDLKLGNGSQEANAKTLSTCQTLVPVLDSGSRYSATSKDWRFRRFINHDLIGSKIFGTSWQNPTWRKYLRLDDAPWLRDHKMGPDVLIPRAGLASMAVEAMFQKYSALNSEKGIGSSNRLAYKLRNVRFDRALVVKEGKVCTLLLTLSKVPGSQDWDEFRISTSKDDVIIDHPFGLIQVQDAIEEKLTGDALAPLKQPTPFTLWYKAQREAGMGFGSSFKKVISLEAMSGERSRRAIVDLTPPKSKWSPQSYYPFHAAVLDACLQVALPANASNEPSLVKDVIVPVIVSEAIINKAKSILANISVYDPETWAVFMKVKGLNYVKLDVVLKPDSHTFDKIVWKPPQQLTQLSPGNALDTKLDTVVDLIAHKKPMLSVLEVSLSQSDTSCIWFEARNMAPRLAYSKPTFASTDAQAPHNGSHCGLELADENTVYDLAIVKTSDKDSLKVQKVVANPKPLLAAGGFTLLVQVATQSSNDQPTPPSIEAQTPQEPYSFHDASSEATSISSDPNYFSNLKKAQEALARNGLFNREKISSLVDSAAFALIIAHFHTTISQAGQELVEALEASEWGVKQSPVSDLTDLVSHDGVVFVRDELYDNILMGSQHTVDDPDKALVHGLFRVIRHEDPRAKLATLDVQSPELPAASWAVDQVLKQINEGKAEEEYVERDGVLYVQRIVPDTDINTFKRDEVDGPTPVVKSLFGTETMVQIRAEKVGSLDLMWNENHVKVGPVEPGFVEVEVMAIGVNFKDVATTIGIVPEDEYMIGSGCSGVVKRLGEGVTKFKVGDRVAVMRSGTYASRLQAPVERTHVIPDWMSFEDAATIPLVYMTALYSLFYLGNLQEGMSVLIHSAAGGVGLAAIQLALHKKARIFVTVGTEEQRDFLASTSGIPKSRMFSSCDTKFAEEIMRETDGRGIDVILNSLTGELLDASWRICADGGVMVEIGKRDIVDRDTLAMKPFDRNCSFRAIDLSYTKHVSPSMVERLLAGIFELVEARHINAIHRIIEYGFDNAPAALAYIRRGQHNGKIVITNHGRDVQVPIRPALRTLQLRSAASYLLVGGLKGLCGSLAIHMARHSAKHIIVCNRSGTSDDTSARVVRGCFTYGCHTMLSSISGVVGNKGQANYAAANAFLDAFAHYRQVQGLPANSVDLGAIKDWTPINEGTLRRILTYSILQQNRYSPFSASSSAQLITGISFPLPNDGSSELTGEARFGYLFNGSSNAVVGDEKGGSTKHAADQAIRAFRLMRESGADDATILKAVVQLVSRQVSRVLRLETEVEPGKLLQAYGLDSLSAVELRGWVRTKLGAELSTLDITNARSLYALCEKVLVSLPQLKAE
ncbi:hypothetical protein F5Y07DRAFT_413612 [Xylaria sp. FL0933]|nr:hypothetical protein F5Y07DRAFT_413612 [Xylaria sp. FL0933]